MPGRSFWNLLEVVLPAAPRVLDPSYTEPHISEGPNPDKSECHRALNPCTDIDSSKCLPVPRGERGLPEPYMVTPPSASMSPRLVLGTT